MKRQAVIAIVGPTASGKTALGVALARLFGGEVVSADSRQVYRGLNLVSGKATGCEMRGVPHHLLDVADPKTPYSASLYADEAKRAIGGVAKRGNVPIVVGGTGFYMDALLRGIVLPEVEPDHALRKKLAGKTAPQLFSLLQKLDPARAKTIERQNPVRLMRAIEIAKSLGAVPAPEKRPVPYHVLWVGLKPSDEVLAKKIRARIKSRMKSGMLEEARRLHRKGLSYKRMRELGLELRHLADLLEQKTSRRQFEENLERDTIRYAKRQMRWFKREKGVRWFASPDDPAIIRLARKFLKTGGR